METVSGGFILPRHRECGCATEERQRCGCGGKKAAARGSGERTFLGAVDGSTQAAVRPV